MKQISMIREYGRKTPVFDTKSVIRLLGDRDYAYLLLNYLVRNGEIKRLTRGYYTMHDDPSLLVYCIKPAYLGLQDAISFHNLWEQETNPVILTTRKIRPGLREVLGSNVIVRRISAKYFFGYEHLRRGDLLIPVSDVEKTFIDMVYFNEMRKDLLRLFLGRIERNKVMEYLKKYDKRFKSKVVRLMS